MTTMKAVRIHTHGSPEVLQYEDVLRPTPQAGEVLIRVYAAAVNPLDCKTRASIYARWPPHTFPWTPGFDVAGVIAALGADVTQFAVGDAVYGSPDAGGYAEYVTIPAQKVAAKPQRLNYLEAAALPIAGITAWQGLFDAAQLTRQGKRC